jgi:glycosyltransferase involved in cell wall biosynthesis
MRIGVVLCTFNGERYLPEQLDSILAQSRPPDAMLVQDDGSTDRTLSILEAYARAPFPVEIVRNDRNLGFVRNFEQAIARCSADIIVLCDQDDYWRRDKLQAIEAIFTDQAQAAAVFSDAEMVDEALAPLGYGLLQALNVSATEIARVLAGDFLPVLLRRNIAAGATIAFRAECRDRLLPIPEGAYHDEWIVLVTAAFGGVRFLPAPLIKYRQHATNQLGARRPRARERIRELLQSRVTENRRRLRVMEGLEARLVTLRAPEKLLAEIKGKLQHLQVRTSLPSKRHLRFGPVARELSSGRYAKYSSGVQTALRDLITPIL